MFKYGAGEFVSQKDYDRLKDELAMLVEKEEKINRMIDERLGKTRHDLSVKKILPEPDTSHPVAVYCKVCNTLHWTDPDKRDKDNTVLLYQVAE